MDIIEFPLPLTDIPTYNKTLYIAPLEETNVTRSKIMYDVNLVISLARLYLLQVLPLGRGLSARVGTRYTYTI